jgi:hypothetical protein
MDWSESFDSLQFNDNTAGNQKIDSVAGFYSDFFIDYR